MNKQLKIVAISGIFAVIAGISVAMNLEQVDAAVGQGVPLKQYGSVGSPVCGDKLCSEAQSLIDIEDDTRIGSISGEDSSAPSMVLIGIDKYKASTNKQGEINYRITFSLTSGDHDLKDILIHVQSDLARFNYEVTSLSTLKSSVHIIRVMAIDPDSITSEIIGYTLTGPTDPTGQFLR